MSCAAWSVANGESSARRMVRASRSRLGSPSHRPLVRDRLIPPSPARDVRLPKIERTRLGGEPRDLKPLLVRRPQPGRLTLGTVRFVPQG